MKVSSALLKPNIQFLQYEYQKLKQQTGFGNSEEADKLRIFIDKQLKELETLLASVSALDQTAESRVPLHVYPHFKKAKHNLRASSRTWSRIVSNESRIRKMQERRPDVATVAA